MSGWRIRPFHPDDLDAVLRLWQHARVANPDPVYSLSEVLASCAADHALVAVVGEEVVGAAVGRAAHEQGWVVFLTSAEGWHGRGIGAALLAALEKQMARTGIAKLSAILPETGPAIDAFLTQGYELRSRLRYVERRLPVHREELGALAEVGGRLLPRGLWDEVGGMRREKELLEKRLVLPLARPDLSERYGIVPPRAVILFGPPGTGKTTFAKAIASRLEWSFVEVFPSRLAGEPAGLAGALRGTFERIGELEHAVVFIDEVEEIASHRAGEPPSPLQGVTNELLKIIPVFREQPNRLLVCATNFIRALDSAFLRHGRFDFVIPIGLPDDEARAAIWARQIPADAAVDLDRVVAASAGFSPADVEYAARRASQQALEDALDAAGGFVGEPLAGPTTGHYLAAVAATKATVSPEMAADFEEDIETLARL